MRIVMAFLLASVVVACPGGPGPIGPTGPRMYLYGVPVPAIIWADRSPTWAWPSAVEVAAEWIEWQGVERANDVMVKP